MVTNRPEIPGSVDDTHEKSKGGQSNSDSHTTLARTSGTPDRFTQSGCPNPHPNLNG